MMPFSCGWNLLAKMDISEIKFRNLQFISDDKNYVLQFFIHNRDLFDLFDALWVLFLIFPTILLLPHVSEP